MAAFRFPAETVRFLTDLRANNTKAWFDANRARYEAGYLQPAKAFVEAIGPQVDELVPGMCAQPRVNGSIFRINRDVRFSSDKTPYKDHLDFWFWEGAKKAAVSGLFLRISPDGVGIGAGAHGFDKDQLAAYRAAAADVRTGAQLAAVVADLEAAGQEIGGQSYRRVPRGFVADDVSERFLRHSALYAHTELPVQAATSATFVGQVVDHWRSYRGLHGWLMSNVAPPALP